MGKGEGRAIMIRTQIQFPDPLYQRLKAIAEQHDWSLAEVMRKAAEHFVSRFPIADEPPTGWRFPTMDCGGDYLADPATLHHEVDAVARRSR